MKSLNFPEGTKLYFDHILNRYFQYLAWECRRLKNNNRIIAYKFQNEMMVVKFRVNGREITKKLNDESHFLTLSLIFYEEN